ncbi:MAG: hypothetical protein AB7G37_04550 [Solirubrobacteraceae bacterium]
MKNFRVIVTAAVVALLLGGGVATAAKSLITSKDIRNNTIRSADIRNGTLTAKDIKKGTITLNRLSKGTQRLVRAGGKAGANGANGPMGPGGPMGPSGARGPQGPAGADGASFDPKLVTAQTSQLFGFTPWYDSNDAGTVDFTDAGVKVSTTAGVVGVNLPIARGTSLSSLESVEYTQTGKAVLGVEIYYRGGMFENGDLAGTKKAGAYRGDYTTVYVSPTADGDAVLEDATAVTVTSDIKKADNTVVVAAGPSTWADVKNAIGTGGAGAYGTDRPAKDNLDAAIILNASFRTTASAGDPTPSEATISKVAIQLRNAAKAVEYGFGS